MDESQDSPQERAVQAALQENEQAIRDMMEAARETTFPTQEDRDMSLLSSGFSYGWRQAFASTEAAGIHKTTALALIRKTVKTLDGYLIDDAPLSTVEALRNEVSEYVVRVVQDLRAGVYRSMEVVYGTEAARVLRKRGHLSDEDAFELGVCVFAADRLAFYGFVVFSEDPKIECRCPMHCKKALMDSATSLESAEAALKARFGTRQSSLLAFGRWFHVTIHQHLDREVGDAEQHPGLDTAAAAKASHDLIGKLSLGGGAK